MCAFANLPGVYVIYVLRASPHLAICVDGAYHAHASSDVAVAIRADAVVHGAGAGVGCKVDRACVCDSRHAPHS